MQASEWHMHAGLVPTTATGKCNLQLHQTDIIPCTAIPYREYSSSNKMKFSNLQANAPEHDWVLLCIHQSKLAAKRLASCDIMSQLCHSYVSMYASQNPSYCQHIHDASKGILSSAQQTHQYTIAAMIC